MIENSDYIETGDGFKEKHGRKIENVHGRMNSFYQKKFMKHSTNNGSIRQTTDEIS